GIRPVDMYSEGDLLFVANLFSDSVSVIDSLSGKVTTEIRLDTAETQAERLPLKERGEQLFFDSRLSLEGWMSCHSCHTDGHANGMLNDNFSDDSFGTPKRVLSLLGVTDTGPWAWNGETPTLEKQVRNSVLNTMRGKEIDDQSVSAMVAFMKTLKLPRLMPDPTSDDSIASEIARGKKLFNSRNCVNCHAPPAFTTAKSYDVGLTDANGTKRFNPPSLRGAAFRTRFLHDGRASSVQDVLGRHKHQADENLTEEEVASIEAYLKSLVFSH
ncbi:MAG: cytochrome c peroxidase, partial [Planctomycetota bacterium]